MCPAEEGATSLQVDPCDFIYFVAVTFLLEQTLCVELLCVGSIPGCAYRGTCPL